MDDKLLWPFSSTSAPGPHVDMPDEPKADYIEALSIVERSPRGAVALLRLAAQKLMISLGQQGENINNDIKALVKTVFPCAFSRLLTRCGSRAITLCTLVRSSSKTTVRWQ